MKNLIAVLLLVVCFSSCKKEEKTATEMVVSDSIKKEEPIAEQPVDSAVQMKAWQEYATPGAPHKLMADEVGTWNCDMTFWSEPNGKPEKATSTANVKMILGGRYQELE